MIKNICNMKEYYNNILENCKTISAKVDPNYVVEYDNEIFRVIQKKYKTENENSRWGKLSEFIKSDEYIELINQNLIINNQIVYEDEDKLILSVKHIENFSFYHFWTQKQKFDCLLKMLEINIFLENYKNDTILIDSHLYNFTLDCYDMKLIDVGCFTSNHRDFLVNSLSCITHPLVNVIKNIKNEKLFEIINYINQGRINFTDLYNKIKNISIIENTNIWDNYDKSELPEHISEIIPNTLEQKELLSIVSKVQPNKILDLGSNIGTFSRLFASINIPVIAIDYSANATNINYESSKKNKLPITSLCLDIIENFDNTEKDLMWNTIISYKKMVSSDMIFASSISHHLYRSGFSFEKQAKFYDLTGSRYVLVEYIHPEDECIQSWNLPKDYCCNSFLNSMSSWKLNKKISFHSTRSWFLFSKI